VMWERGNNRITWGVILSVWRQDNPDRFRLIVVGWGVGCPRNLSAVRQKIAVDV
jgi:hypothetical protein